MIAVDLFDPGLGIGESTRVELVRSPGSVGPVAPVLNDIIKWNFSPAESGDDIEALVLGFVSLAGLPEAENPLRHHWATGEVTISGDHIVDFWAVDKIVIDSLPYFRPEGNRRLSLGAGRFPLKLNV